MRHLGAVILLVTTLAAAGGARAQELEPPRNRQGYYLGLTLDSVVLDAREKERWLGAWSGGGFSLRLGERFTRRFGLGLQIMSGGAKGKGQNAALGALLAELQYEAFTNFAVRAGAGVGFVQLHDPTVKDEGVRGGAGATYVIGVSRDFFPFSHGSGGLALTPTLSLQYLPSPKVDAVAGYIGLEIAWWTGRPREQLALPDDEAYRRR